MGRRPGGEIRLRRFLCLRDLAYVDDVRPLGDADAFRLFHGRPGSARHRPVRRLGGKGGEPCPGDPVVQTKQDLSLLQPGGPHQLLRYLQHQFSCKPIPSVRQGIQRPDSGIYSDLATGDSSWVLTSGWKAVRSGGSPCRCLHRHGAHGDRARCACLPHGGDEPLAHSHKPHAPRPGICAFFLPNTNAVMGSVEKRSWASPAAPWPPCASPARCSAWAGQCSCLRSST